MFLLLLTTVFSYHVKVNNPLPSVMSWDAWKKVFRAEGYTSTQEHDFRQQVYESNVKFILKTNAQNLTYTVGVNQFADMKNSEYRAKMLRPFNRTRKYNPVKLDIKDPLDNVDWRTKGAVTPVKNQGQCGSCWAFSTTGAVEGCVQIASGKLLSLSEQELVNCDKTSNGCGGGLMDYGFEWIASNGGINSEANWGYTAQDGMCNDAKKAVKVGKTMNHVDVQQNSAAQFAQALNQGPVSIAIEADQQAFQFYQSGIFSAACGTKLDHGVLAVGYADDYWIVKNSWGETWGAQGYILLARKITQVGGQCGLLMQPSFPTQCSALTPTPPGPDPGPTPSPGMMPYADPKNGCMTGEGALTVTNVAGSFCSQSCDNGAVCPQTGDNMLGFASCGIYQGGHLQCGVFCSVDVASSCDPNNKFTCKDYNGVSGLCTYDD